MYGVEPRTVLIVDDQESIRALVGVNLELDDRFSRVDGASSAEDAVAAAARTPYDVIILDENMPGGAGTAVIPDLRRACPAARIILYSAVAGKEVRARAAAAGADACVSKSTSMRALLELAAA